MIHSLIDYRIEERRRVLSHIFLGILATAKQLEAVAGLIVH